MDFRFSTIVLSSYSSEPSQHNKRIFHNKIKILSMGLGISSANSQSAYTYTYHIDYYICIY